MIMYGHPPHTRELPKAQKTGMPLPNRSSRMSRCSEAMRPSGSRTQPSQSAAVLPKSSGSTQPLPSHNQQLEHMLDTSMTLRRQDHKITECSNKKRKHATPAKKPRQPTATPESQQATRAYARSQYDTAEARPEDTRMQLARKWRKRKKGENSKEVGDIQD